MIQKQTTTHTLTTARLGHGGALWLRIEAVRCPLILDATAALADGAARCRARSS